MRKRLAALHGEAGMTLIELLVAAAMGIVVVGGATAMLISAVRTQPEQSRRAQNISTARFELERMTREIRNGVSVDPTRANPYEVSFVARVRRTTCGGGVPPDPNTPAIKCQVTYSCTTTSCSRIEAAEGVFTGTPTTIVTGIDSPSVFCFTPSANADPTECGTAKSGTSPTYIGVTLRVPNPTGTGLLTVSDGASLRSAALSF